MFAFPWFRRDRPALRARDVSLRLPVRGDYREWAALRDASRSFLEPWEPSWSSDELSRAAWRQRLRRYREDFSTGSAIAFLVFENTTGRLVGGITLGHIRHGVAQSGQIGYWMGESHAGKGYMSEAIGLVVSYAFDTLRLHRIEAACIPENTRSIRVLEKAGFRREGLLRSYLRINGSWQDHYLYALIAGDHRGGTTRG